MKKAGLLFSIFLVLLIVTILSIGTAALRPYEQAKREAFAIARQQADLQTEDQFYWYNGEETYFSFFGKDGEGKEKVVIIHQDGGEVTVLNAEEVIPESTAWKITKRDKEPKRILEARIGLERNDEPVWEVSYEQQNGTIGYYVLSLKTGEWIQNIENI